MRGKSSGFLIISHAEARDQLKNRKKIHYHNLGDN